MEAIRVEEVLLKYYVVDPSTPGKIHSVSNDNIPWMTEVHESVDIPFRPFWNASVFVGRRSYHHRVARILQGTMIAFLKAMHYVRAMVVFANRALEHA